MSVFKESENRFMVTDEQTYNLDDSRNKLTNVLAYSGKLDYVYECDEVFSTWMAFGGNARDLGSFGEETDKITDLHQILEEVLVAERGDGVVGIKRRCRDPSNDGVKDLETASGRSRLNEDLE
ncbi:hypothetical protein Tco_1044462 [Tanacetum coccineum]|uniref:Uncharacterized protein n=1 Tax=Tanacetum coccineum TaxID=301880 RepID=A0ABQ5GS72_9ASTR